MSLGTSETWRRLAAHRDALAGTHLRDLFARDPGRAERYSQHVGSLYAGSLYVDYSKHVITDETLALLRALAVERGVEAWRDRMFAGDAINTTEGRAVLHVALRDPRAGGLEVDGRDVRHDVQEVLGRMA
ncbi:MAG: glucose-6-phosphate isomerase, partial [Vicinamibacteria bacterium]